MQLFSIFFSIILIFNSFQASYSYNYLIFCPLFGHSHTKFFAEIADTLTDAGHNVTFFIPTIVQKYETMNYTKSTKDIVHLKANNDLKLIGDLMESADFARFWTHDSNIFEIIPTIKIFQLMFEKLNENVGNNLDVLDGLKTRNFDVMIYEAYVYCAHPVRDYLGIKTIAPSLSITHDTDFSRSIGEPANPSYLPNALSPFGDNMSFKERLSNIVGEWVFGFFLQMPVYNSFNPPHQPIDIIAEEAKTSFGFMNSNPFIDFPKPTIAKTVQIGGISVDVTGIRQQKLDEEYNKILNRRSENVVISFGSVMFSKDMPQSYKSNILKVIQSFPNVTFIWKYEEAIPPIPDVSEKLENVVFKKWIPQTGLLADSRVTAFITHGGLGSVNELCYLGKPAIVIPLYADQMRNAKMLTRHNTSISISKYDLADFDTVYNAVNRILHDKTFSKNAAKLGRELELQPIKPKELLVKYAEFAAEFGELRSLDPYFRQMSFFTYHLIDIFLFLLFIFIVIIFTISKTLQFFIKCLSKKFEKQKKL